MPRSHHHIVDDPAGPPPEVLDAIGAAWERAQRPLPEGLELAFEAALGRAWGELRDEQGTTAAVLSATGALALACGDAAVRAVPEPVAV